MSVALLFPGQGSQSAGFLHSLPEHPVVHETLHEASCALEQDVLALDTEQALASTVSAQLALTIAGVAFARLCAVDCVRPAVVAGMSVGAYSAAVAAGAIEFGPVLRLVRRRAELMETAFSAGAYGMVVVEGLRLGAVRQIAIDTGVSIANYNADTQYVLAGRIEDLEASMQLASDAGAHRAQRLRMSVASHTADLLQQADELLTFSRQFELAAPGIPMYSSRKARALTTAEAVREELALNMAYPVHWQDTVTAIGSLGMTCLIEAPPGHTLTRLTSAILPEATALAAVEVRWDVLVRTARHTQGS